jgi:hypothetical protein
LCSLVIYLFTVGYTVKNIPRKWGIMGFFGCVMVINMMFNFDFVEKSTFVSSLLFGIARILSSIFHFNLVNAYCLIVCM